MYSLRSATWNMSLLLQHPVAAFHSSVLGLGMEDLSTLKLLQQGAGGNFFTIITSKILLPGQFLTVWITTYVWKNMHARRFLLTHKKFPDHVQNFLTFPVFTKFPDNSRFSRFVGTLNRTKHTCFF